jgi:hypothetical protein
MLDLQLLLIPTLLFLGTVSFGFWVRARGRPYHPLLFNIHKLVALAGVIFLGKQMRLLILDSGLSEGVLVPAILVAGSLVLLFATGALLSIRAEESKTVVLFHRAGTIVISLCLGLLLFL